MGACPYLGLSDDPTLMLSEPSPAHRCMAVRPAKSPNEAYQSSHCLVGEHHRCQYYIAAESHPTRKRVANATGRSRRRPGSERGSYFPAFLGLLLLALVVAVAVLGATGRGAALTGVFVNAQAAPDVAEAAADQQVAVARERSLSSESPTSSAQANALENSLEGGQPAEMPARPVAAATRIDDSEADDSLSPGAIAALRVAAGGPAAVAAALGVETTPGLAAVAAPATFTATPSATPSPAAPAQAAATTAPETVAPAMVALASAAEGVAIPAAGDSTAGTEYRITPGAGDSGWWANDPAQPGELGDSFLYAGRQGSTSFLSAIRFDLSRIPRGAPLLSGELTLTGLAAERLNSGEATPFRAQLIAERELASFAGADFMSLYSVPASITSLRDLPAAELQAGSANRWTLDANVLRWLEQQRLDGARSITVRLGSAGEPTADTLFAWDSGLGQKSRGAAPTLLLVAGAPPPTPPALPTRDYLVATFTPVPVNVNTAVAHQQTATAVAQTIGTYTPVPA
ncbi:MAG: hypothetical protein ACRC1H_03185, partial [Caldilineaceae bacterium]